MSLHPSKSGYDVIVLGAGAAGLMCAAEAGRRGLRVLLLEAGERAGRKILISGGGRCNFTNLHTTAANFLSANPHFARSALARYTPRDFIALVEKHRIPYHEKTLGQLFCDGPAQAIVTMLEAECRAAGVELRLRTPVVEVARDGNSFSVATPSGPLRASSVVVATGGLSIPKMGASGIGYRIAESFGHTLVEPRPALVPLVLAAEDQQRWCDLAGVSADVIAQAEALGTGRRNASPPAFREKLLITHRGLSGPAVLQASSYWQPGLPLRFDLAPGQTALFAPLLAETSHRGPALALQCLRAKLPVRLAERWLQLNQPGDWKTRSIEAMESALHGLTLTPYGTEGFAKAEVTAGGVSTAELSSTTMESRRVSGLYFIGEVVDVTGHLGGHNFQWAWASAVAAAEALSGVRS